MPSYFDDGSISEKRFERARTAVRLELEPISEAYRKLGWLQAFGSSGTVRVIGDVVRRLNPESPRITLENLRALADRIIAAGHVDDLDLEDVDAERAPVFPAGLAIMLEIVENFGIDRVRVAEGAMREGLLYDLMGRFTDEDARVRSVRAMEKRYHVDAQQADRVETTAAALLAQVETEWGLEDPLAELMLRWAARLHEAGLDIAHSKYHRHSAYLLEHADMPGFPARGAAVARCAGGRPSPAALVRVARGPRPSLGPSRGVSHRAPAARRGLHRGRSLDPLPDAVRLVVKGHSLTLELPEKWMKDHPLTIEDLEQERALPQGCRFSAHREPRESRRRCSRLRERDPLVVEAQQFRLCGDIAGAVGTRVLAVRGELPRLTVIGEVQLQLLRHAGAELGRLDGKSDLDAPEKIPVHPIGARAVHFGIAAVPELVHARMLEEPADDRAHLDSIGHPRHTGPQAANSAHDEIRRTHPLVRPDTGPE